MKFFSLLALCSMLSSCAAMVNLMGREQDPTDRPYQIEQIQFTGGSGVTLAGELTMPNTGGPFKTVVLVSGSGPQDRNEAVVGHRPFLVWSDHLTRAGFAVLRYDDRGVGESTGDYALATIQDFAEDTAGAVRWLAARPDISSENIGIMGHSEGGYIAPAAALEVPVAFMVLLAGAVKPLLPDVMTTQYNDILTSTGADASTISQARRQVKKLTEILQGSGSVADKRAELDAYLIQEDTTATDRKILLNFWVTPWGVFAANYDPRPALRAFDGPVLAVFGSTDLQVSARDNAPEARRILRHLSSKVVVLDGLNHLFQPSKTGSIDDYPWIETTVDVEALMTVSTWIHAL
ncbi:MAG: alpha/beta fold hydrolase [Oceanospirillaceae bacterium]|nr:alpha/beta fold hydrolase [Oceanospirillaceae bacterium]